jgi:outer membrane protein insertion porin family
MALRLGRDGYAFAKIDPVPQEDKETKEIALTFVVDPGNRAYVRHINFKGTTSINDDVLRREMRQMEGGYLSNAAVERSKQRLQRLPYIEKVEVETTPVAGTPDLVDVDFDIKEGLPGQFSAGIGYSESQSFILSGSFVHSNFMGTGNRVAAEVNGGQYSKIFSLSHTDPYTTVDGVSRTVSATYRKLEQYTQASSDFETETGTLGLDYAWPITEFQSVRMGLVAQRADLFTDPNSSARGGVRLGAEQRQYLHEIAEVGNPPISSHSSAPSSTPSSSRPAGASIHATGRCSRIVARAPVGASYTLPGSDVEYFSVSYDYLQFIPINRHFTIMWNTELGYGDALGDTTSLPPFRNYFAGGPETVRGYQESELGPKDSFGNPYGGNLKVINQLELLLPIPEKWRNAARFSIFVDAGNVFSTGGVDFVGIDGVTPVEYKFGFDKLRASTGVAVQWLAPLGVFRFSYAYPLNDEPGGDVLSCAAAGMRLRGRDRRLQFSIGQAF